MGEKELLPNLFRAEYQKIVSVLIHLFGIHHIEVAEDIVSDTFLSAAELWVSGGIPDNPEAWLFTVARNKTRNYLKRHAHFEQKLVAELRNKQVFTEEVEIDLSVKNIADSQLAMIFTVCDPVISSDAQVSLALNLLCGFGVTEIAEAFLTNKEVIYKRINRAKDKLKAHNIRIEQPSLPELESRLGNVLKTLYLLFSEGYYSVCQDAVVRKDMCAEAMRLTYLLTEQEATAKPEVFALLALMCFHSSRFDARVSEEGEAILYAEQDEELWNAELISAGEHFLNKAAAGDLLSKYHLEAAIAYWHTKKADTPLKWQHILDLYEHLLSVDYSPIIALNGVYALYKVSGAAIAITAAEKLSLLKNHFYHSLLGTLYKATDREKAMTHFQTALSLANTEAERKIMLKHIGELHAA